ncbi:hypothetical protein R5R35_009042 [Gryllus longicercus]|uniref:Uncharacterized protein n=1 Tax=Gryllus longicercus TaxID=2509291 RepID=A0AAN9VZQ4_9ORTH
MPRRPLTLPTDDPGTRLPFTGAFNAPSPRHLVRWADARQPPLSSRPRYPPLMRTGTYTTITLEHGASQNAPVVFTAAAGGVAAAAAAVATAGALARGPTVLLVRGRSERSGRNRRSTVHGLAPSCVQTH